MKLKAINKDGSVSFYTLKGLDENYAIFLNEVNNNVYFCISETCNGYGFKSCSCISCRLDSESLIKIKELKIIKNLIE